MAHTVYCTRHVGTKAGPIKATRSLPRSRLLLMQPARHELPLHSRNLSNCHSVSSVTAAVVCNYWPGRRALPEHALPTREDNIKQITSPWLSMVEQISRDYDGGKDDDAQNLKRASADSRQQTGQMCPGYCFSNNTSSFASAL